MVVMNASIGIILKFLSTFCPVYDLAKTVKYFFEYKNNAFSKIRQCSLDFSLVSVEKFSLFLYTLSFSILLPFYYNFDQNFKKAFNLIVKTQKSNNRISSLERQKSPNKT